MTVIDVVYKVRSDYNLERIAHSAEFLNLPNFFGTFDARFQELSSEVYCRQQFDKHVIHCLRTQTFYCFFVWDRFNKLHLLNSRSEVKRFLKTQDAFKTALRNDFESGDIVCDL